MKPKPHVISSLFVHKQNDISNKVKITETFTNATLDEVLKKVLSAHGYDYSIEGKVIIIKKKVKKAEPKQEIITVKGRVVDEKGNPLPGVSVVINQTSRGVATDRDGKYDILVRADDVLKFSFIGYKDQTVPVEGKAELNVALQPTAENLEEVTVVAYGEQKAESVVGAVTTVKPSSLKTSNSDLTASFVGRIPGMIGFQLGGRPGALTENEMNTIFSIRGISSFGSNANTKPLILMDGVEVSVLDLSRIDPEDIDSFSVLKDASATAMYGARGANGVIIVTTKKGEEGSVYTAFRYEAVASTPTRKIDVVDPITYMKAYNEALQTRDPLAQPKYTADRIANTGNSERFPYYVYPCNDWYGLLFKDVSINHRVGLSVRGGTKIMQYYASLSHTFDEGMIKTDKLNSFDVNIRNNTTALRLNMSISMTPSAKLNVTSNTTLDNNHGPEQDVTTAYQLAFYANPVDYPAIYPADSTFTFPHIRFGYGSLASYNPYADIQKGYVERTRFSTSNKIQYIQNLSTLLKGLEFRAIASIYQQGYYTKTFTTTPYKYRLLDYNYQNNTFALESLSKGDKNLRTPTDKQYSSNSTQVSGDFRLYYNGNWGDHAISYTGLFNLSQSSTSDGGSLFSCIKQRNMGLSMRLSYGFKERYYLEGSFGYNGSERFAKHNRFGFFPAIGMSYVISKEPFMANAKHWLSFLKLRASYGKVGNDGIGYVEGQPGIPSSGRYIYLENIYQEKPGEPYQILAYANPKIQWEISEQVNLGLEMTFLNGLFDFTIDVYQAVRHNILGQRTIVPASMGLGIEPYVNIGKTRSRGVDFAGKIQHSFSNSLWFILNGTLTYNKVIYKAIEEGADVPAWQRKVGRDISQQIGYIAEGLFQSQAEIDRSPLQSGDVMPGDIRYRDVNGDGKISIDDAVPIGFPTQPRLVYGFSGTVYYKRFEFNFAFQGSGQRSLFLSSASLSPFVNDHALLTEIWNDHWSPENMKVRPFWPRLSTKSITEHNKEEARSGQTDIRYSTYFMREVKFLRCQSLELAYTLPEKWVKKIRLQRVKPYVRVNNPFLISNFKLWDVELGSNGFNYPIQRTYSVGVNLTF